MTHSFRSQESGFIALIAVIIAGAIMLAAGLATTYRGVDAENAVLAQSSSRAARELANACAEEAIVRLRANFAYEGNERILVHGTDTCDIEEISGSGTENRVINTSARVGDYVQHIAVDVATLAPDLVVRSWAVVL